MRHFRKRPISLEQVSGLLCENFELGELCKHRGIDLKSLGEEGSSLHLTGLDGKRHVPIKTDEDLLNFFTDLLHSRVPSIEARLVTMKASKPQPASGHAATKSRDLPAGSEPHPEARIPRDRVEQLEDENFKLERTLERVTRRIDELERLLAKQGEEGKLALTHARRDVAASQEKLAQELHAEIKGLKEKDASILGDLDVVRQHLAAVEEEDKRGQDDLSARLGSLNEIMENQFGEVQNDLENLREADERLQAEDERQEEQLGKHAEELSRLEASKVDVDLWTREEEKMGELIRKNFEELSDRITETTDALNKRLEQENSERVAADAELLRDLNQRIEKKDEELKKLNSDLVAGLEAASAELAKVREEVLLDTEKKVTTLEQSTAASFKSTHEEIATKDAAIHRRAEELGKKTEGTFQQLNERLEEMVRVERARLGSIERDLSESTTKTRSDCRAEIERVRTDYEQEASRIDADLGDLHMKHDVTKQEINFFQSRLQEMRDWAQRQLTETAIATRAAQVDAQEGLAAATKMLHALKDDAVQFRERMAKYIQLLQHSTDTQGDAINTLETQRNRMRGELDALIGDHKDYTGDMDGWADDVRLKVERLFRALEPGRMEWCIKDAAALATSMKRPLPVKSPCFTVRGLYDATIEFYPNGHNYTPEGKAAVRMFMSLGAHVRYQLCIGKLVVGTFVYKGKPGDSPTTEMTIDRWTDQITEDDAISISLEVLQDYNNDDQSLSREIRIESLQPLAP